MYRWIWENTDWPAFRWDSDALIHPLGDVRTRIGRLQGTLSVLGMQVEQNAALSAMTADIVESSGIEGVVLDAAQVRSSVALRLGLPTEGLPVPSHYIDGLVDVMVDACRHADAPITHSMLWDYHRKLFPAGGPNIGCYRHSNEPMRVISGVIGRETVHFEAPPADRVADMMEALIQWVNGETIIDPIIKAGVSALWFVTIHPFCDGNGRLSRTITDKLLAQADRMPQRYYSMTAAIQQRRSSYYQILEATQRGSMDITPWLKWFLECLSLALQNSDKEIAQALRRAQFWEKHADISFNPRQRRVLSKFMDSFEGKLTTSKYAKMAKCAPDTALRDLKELVNYGILRIDGIGRSTHYVWN